MPCILVIFISSAWHSVDVYWIKNIFYSENLKYCFFTVRDFVPLLSKWDWFSVKNHAEANI